MTPREETHARAKTLIESAGSQFVSVEFFKKDGTLRLMQVHPTAIRNRVVGDAASDRAKQANATKKENHPEIYPVVDAVACRAGLPEDKTIRTINLDTLVSITVNHVRHEFEPVTL